MVQPNVFARFVTNPFWDENSEKIPRFYGVLDFQIESMSLKMSIVEKREQVLKNGFREKIPFFEKNEDSVYLDSAATALKPKLLSSALAEVYERGHEIVHRGAHALADVSTERYESVRADIAQDLGVESSEVVFTSGTTAGCNQAAWSWGLCNLHPGDEILVSIAEHHSSALPWLEVARHKGATVRWARFDRTTSLFRDDDFEFKPKTKVLILSAFSNVLGALWQSDEQLRGLIERAHQNGIVVVLDGAQRAPFYKTNLRLLNPDFYMYSAHKMFGPQGLGVLFVNQRMFNQLRPALVGGGTVTFVSQHDVVYKVGGASLEAGTPPVAQIIAWGEVLKWVRFFDFDVERARLGRLMSQLLEGLNAILGVRILGNQELLRRDGHLLSLVVDDVHAHDIVDILNDHKIFVRAGLMCAQPLHEFLGVSASLRVSLHWYSTEQDIARFCGAFASAVERLRRV